MTQQPHRTNKGSWSQRTLRAESVGFNLPLCIGLRQERSGNAGTLRQLVAEKGKPGENPGRKASGLRVLMDTNLGQQGCLK